jgi:hypothetical protein
MRRAPGKVAATLALVVALCASAFAAGGLPGKNSVRSGDIANGEVKSPDLGAQAVSRKAFRNGSVSDGDVRALDSVSATLSAPDGSSVDGDPIIGRPGLRLFPRCTRFGAEVTAGLSLATDPDVPYQYSTFHTNGGSSGSGSGGGISGIVGVHGETRIIAAFSSVIVTRKIGGGINRLSLDGIVTVHGDQAECEFVVNVKG